MNCVCCATIGIIVECDFGLSVLSNSGTFGLSEKGLLGGGLK